jgi:hypothetical protein
MARPVGFELELVHIRAAKHCFESNAIEPTEGQSQGLRETEHIAAEHPLPLSLLWFHA